MSLSEQQRIRAAEERVDAQIGFFIHLAIYVVVIALLAFLDWRGGDDWWVHWPALGWGLGLLLHATLALSKAPRVLSRWRMRRIHEERSNL